jgi:hypothetical protein
MPSKQRDCRCDPERAVGRLLLQLKLQATALKKDQSLRTSREVQKLVNAVEGWLSTAETGPTAFQRAMAQVGSMTPAGPMRKSRLETRLDQSALHALVPTEIAG